MAKCDPSVVINIGKKYDGYLEKATNAKLDDFKANAGSNNYTRFGRDYDKVMGTKLNGQSWCAMFVSMIFVESYGLAAAKKLLGGNLFSYTPTGCSQMKAKKKTPKAGDVVFFYSNSMGRISHVGLVVKVDSKKFYTVEGNTSSDPGVVRNGGSVNQKSYTIGYSNAYFGTPAYSSVTTGKDTVKTAVTPISSHDKDSKNPYSTPKEVIKKGSKGGSVKWVQWELNQWKSSLKIDGDFGSATEAQVKAFQKVKGLKVDGVVGDKTIAALKKDK